MQAKKIQAVVQQYYNPNKTGFRLKTHPLKMLGCTLRVHVRVKTDPKRPSPRECWKIGHGKINVAAETMAISNMATRTRHTAPTFPVRCHILRHGVGANIYKAAPPPARRTGGALPRGLHHDRFANAHRRFCWHHSRDAKAGLGKKRSIFGFRALLSARYCQNHHIQHIGRVG